MAKGNVTIDITNSDYVYIDGATGEQLTKEQFNARHAKGVRSFLGANRIDISKKEGDGTEKES